MNFKSKKNPVGRPPLDGKENTIRIGFCIPEDLWLWVMKLAEKREVGYSVICREALERLQIATNR